MDEEGFETLKTWQHLHMVDLLMSRKLTLLVDLDNTLLHTEDDGIIGAENCPDLIRWSGQEFSDWSFTKIRPYTLQFLHNMSELYELRICTMGNRAYAWKMAELLDNDGALFGDRIHSRDDLLPIERPSKIGHLTNLFPCGDFMVVIIDDREDVWNSPGNLIRVEPYEFFFPGSDNKMTVRTDDHDNYLLHLETHLRKVHHNFYTALIENDRDTPLPNIKEIVAGITNDDESQCSVETPKKVETPSLKLIPTCSVTHTELFCFILSSILYMCCMHLLNI